MLKRAALIPFVVCVFVSPVASQDHALDPHEMPENHGVIEDGVDYRVYDRQGNPTSLMAIVGAVVGDDVLLVGEEHGDMIGHAFEARLFRATLDEIGGAASAGRPVVLSLEMFERDVQYVLDEYLAGLISEDHFLRSSRPWDDYESRYRSLIEAAKERGAPIVAANAPRRYVSRVTSEGAESLAELSDHARSFLPPLPYPGPSDVYREQWQAVMDESMEEMRAAADAMSAEESGSEEEGAEADGATDSVGADADQPAGPERSYQVNPNAIYSQALWDASMGHAITEALVRHMGGLVVHFAGSFHVAQGTGIPERIADYRPGTRVTTVVMSAVDDIDTWSDEEHGGLADFVVLTKKPDSER